MEYKTFVPGADDAAVLKLRANVWGAEHPHTTPEYLHWLLGDTPAGAGSGVMMLDDHEVVGFAGLLPRCVDIKKESQIVAQGLDYMVHTEARSQAGSFRIALLWTQLARELGFAFGMCFPNTNSHKILTRSKLGWEDAFWPELMVRPLSRAAVPQLLAGRIPPHIASYGAGLMAALGNARAGWSLRHKPRGGAFVIDHFDSRFNHLWQQVRAASSSGIRRDAAYLNWRFVRQPCYSYLRVGWESRGEVSAYVIASAREVLGVPSMLVVDQLAAPGAESCAVEALLEEVASRARADGRQLLAALAIRRSAVQDTLARVGFVHVPRRLNPKPFVMVTHGLGKPRSLAACVTNWHFTWADTDVV